MTATTRRFSPVTEATLTSTDMTSPTRRVCHRSLNRSSQVSPVSAASISGSSNDERQ